MAHFHSHNHTEHSVNAPVRILYICLAINLIFVAAEAFAGWKSIDKIINPQEINATAVIAVSSVAIFINGFTAWLLMKGQGDDINIKPAYSLHSLL